MPDRSFRRIRLCKGRADTAGQAAERPFRRYARYGSAFRTTWWKLSELSPPDAPLCVPDSRKSAREIEESHRLRSRFAAAIRHRATSAHQAEAVAIGRRVPREARSIRLRAGGPYVVRNVGVGPRRNRWRLARRRFRPPKSRAPVRTQ